MGNLTLGIEMHTGQIPYSSRWGFDNDRNHAPRVGYLILRIVKSHLAPVQGLGGGTNIDRCIVLKLPLLQPCPVCSLVASELMQLHVHYTPIMGWGGVGWGGVGWGGVGWGGAGKMHGVTYSGEESIEPLYGHTLVSCATRILQKKIESLHI